MGAFDFVFPMIMILCPAFFTLFVSTKPTSEAVTDDDRRSRIVDLTRRLWIWTGVAAGLYVALYFAYVHPLIRFMWVAFFPLWFALAMPLLRAKDPGWGPVPRSSIRTARLVRRDELPAAISRIWISVAAIWVIIAGLTVIGLALPNPGSHYWWVISFTLAAGLELWFLHWAMRRSLIEAEAMSANETLEIRQAREDLRNLKLYGWTFAGAAVMLVFSIPALLIVWFGDHALTAAIIVGAGGGSLVGVGGGVFGTLADLRRARINRLCLEQSPGE